MVMDRPVAGVNDLDKITSYLRGGWSSQYSCQDEASEKKGGVSP
jgi:hypothetical protein